AVALVDPRGRVLSRADEPVDTATPNGPVDQIVRMARAMRSERDFAAAGAAIPGLVRRDGTVWAPNLPGWDAMPLAKLLRARLRVPVTVESDRNTAVLGEAWRGAARGKDDVIVLIVGTGVGAGILSGGRLVRGAHELSGCAGWMVTTEARDEWTKKVGGLESLIAGPAIGRIGGTTSADLAERARRGDRKAKEIFQRVGQQLGAALANLISLFDPEAIVLTGGVASASDLYLEEATKVARALGQPLSAPKVDIVVTTLGAEANLLGAARLALVEAHSVRRSPVARKGKNP
ncbi:MAG TPA: ROK family protein, partial [Thermoanaerobaculia bacterium]